MTNIYTVCVVDPNLTSHFRMALAERFPSLHEKTFALQVFLAKSAVKALTVIVVVEGLDPSVSGFNGKSARNTLCREQLVPVFFTVWKPVLKVEWWIGKYFATISTNKTLRVECLSHRLQTVLYANEFRFILYCWFLEHYKCFCCTQPLSSPHPIKAYSW